MKRIWVSLTTALFLAEPIAQNTADAPAKKPIILILYAGITGGISTTLPGNATERSLGPGN